MNNSEKLDDRINHLESMLAYLQNDYDQLNQAVLDNSKRLDQLKQSIDRLVDRLDAGPSSPDSGRNLEDEKPPHY